MNARTDTQSPWQTDAEGLVLLKSMNRETLTRWVVEEMGEKPFRAKQLWKWMYVHLVGDLDEMTDLSKAFRERLRQHSRVDVLSVKEVFQATDGTRKILWNTLSGA